MAFIYYFEDNARFIPFVKPLFELIEEGEIPGKTSIISYLEILVKPKREGKDLLVDQYSALLDNYPNLEILPVDKNIADEASNLRAKYNLKTPDAIQVATAVLSNAAAFITNDPLLKRVKEIEIIVMEEILNEAKDKAEEK